MTKNSIFHNRKVGLYAALGISLAIWINVAYLIAGLAVVISNSVVLFPIIKYLGAAYLIYMKWIRLQSKPSVKMMEVSFLLHIFYGLVWWLSVYHTPSLLQLFNNYKTAAEKVIGVALIGFGLKVALTNNG